MSSFEKCSDNVLGLMRELSTEFREEEHVVALKDKFVDLNNAANWVAETIFKNTIGSMYVENIYVRKYLWICTITFCDVMFTF